MPLSLRSRGALDREFATPPSLVSPIGRTIHQHLALPFEPYLGAHGGQVGLQEARQPCQPILLLYPLPWGILGTREDERRTSPGPLGLLFLVLNKTHSAIEL